MGIPRTARNPVDADRDARDRLRAARSACAVWLLLSAAAAHAQLVLPNDPLMGGGGLGYGGAAGFGGALPGLAPGRIAPGPRGPLDWTAGIGTRLTYTDNGALAPKGQERPDTIFEVFPFVSLIAAGARTQGVLTYSPRLVVRDLDTVSGDGLTHRLEARGNMFLVDESIGVMARASISDVNARPFGTVAFDPGLNPVGRATYKLAEVAPYARGAWGRTDYLVRYGLTWIDDGVRPYDVTEQLLSALLSNLSARGPLGWRLYGEQRHTAFSTDLNYDRSYVTALGTYSFSPELRLGLGANYARSDLVLSDTGSNGGWGPSATIEWFPTPRTSLFAAWSGTYYGRAARARLSHRAVNWLFGLAYSDSIQDNVASGAVVVSPALLQGGTAAGATAPDPSSPQIQQLLSAAPPGQILPGPLSYGTLNSALVHIQSLTATVGYTAGRTTYLANAFLTKQDNDLTLASNVPGGSVPQDLEQRGLDGRISHRMTPVTTIGALVRWQRSQSDLFGATSTLSGVQLDVGYLVTPTITAGAGYRYVRQRGDSAPTFLGYDENAVFVTALARF